MHQLLLKYMGTHMSRQMALDGLLDPVVGWVPTEMTAWLALSSTERVLSERKGMDHGKMTQEVMSYVRHGNVMTRRQHELNLD